MDVWIIAENEDWAVKLSNSLSRQGIFCQADQVIDMKSAAHDLGFLVGFSGIVFVGISELESSNSAMIHQLCTVLTSESKLVVVSSAVNCGAVLQAVRLGASDFLRADETLDDEIQNFVTRIQLERKRSKAKSQVVTVVPCHSASDANIVAVNLSAMIAADKGACGLLDYHFRGGDLAYLLKLTPRHTVLDLLNQSDTIDSAMLKQAMSIHESGIHLLAGPASFADMSNLRFQACQEITVLSQQCWSHVIVNVEDIQHAEQIQAITACDDIVLTMRLEVASLSRTQRHLEFLEQHQYPSEQVHVVAMGTGYSGELPMKAVKKVLKVSEIHSLPDDPVTTIMSVNVGNPMVFERPNAKPSLAIQSFAKSLCGLNKNEKLGKNRTPIEAVKAAASLTKNTLARCC